MSIQDRTTLEFADVHVGDELPPLSIDITTRLIVSTALAVKIRLGAPNYPGDTMVIKGKVIEVNSDAKTVDVEVGGKNGLGYHLTGTVTVALP